MNKNQKGSIQLLVPVVVLLIATLGLTTSSNITSTSYPTPQVLGEEEDESAKKAAEQAKEAAQKAAEQAKEFGTTNFQSEGNKSETEIETPDGQKIKTKVEDDGSTKIEIEQKNKKLKIEAKAEKTEIEIEDEEASESSEEDLEEVRNISKFPLRIDTNTNQLIMTKNGVERVLTILPAKAVQNMLRAHLKNGLGPKFFGDATQSATPSSEPIAIESEEITIVEDQITLEEEDGQAVYRIPAKKHLKLLGVIPVTTDMTSFVSAETGNLIKDQESFLSRFLDFLSP